jgi:hypothetical protein
MDTLFWNYSENNLQIIQVNTVISYVEQAQYKFVSQKQQKTITECLLFHQTTFHKGVMKNRSTCFLSILCFLLFFCVQSPPNFKTPFTMFMHLFDAFPIHNVLRQQNIYHRCLKFCFRIRCQKVQENKDGVKLSGTHQLLVYSDNVNSLG